MLSHRFQNTRRFIRTPALKCTSSATPKPASFKSTILKAVPLTSERFKPFGQIIAPTDDGKVYDEEDAQLALDQGTQRFYIMRLPARGMTFRRITYHAKVTQCLGGLNPGNWYMAVARPSGSVEEYPKVEDLVAFRIPLGVAVKMEQGTWHAGPLFDDLPHRDFYNLELADTNVTDHNTHDYGRQGMEFTVVDDEAPAA